GLSEQHRADRVASVLDRPPDDEPALGDEQAAAAGKLGVREARILGCSRVVRHDRHEAFRVPLPPLRLMRRLLPAALVAALVGISSPAAAPPSPFSYVDVRLQGSELRVAVVAHVYDVAHDLGVEPV